MPYTSKITYPTYDLNGSQFQEIIRELLQVEMLKQRTTYAKTFLPQIVKGDEYLLSPIADSDLNPAFCSVLKAQSKGTEQNFGNQQNDLNHYVIGVLANGLENLRKITDTIYIILNDLDVKGYLFKLQNSSGDNYIFDSGTYQVIDLKHDYTVEKTMNDKNVIYGALVLQVQIAETPQINTYPDLVGIDVDLQVGSDQKEISLQTNL